MCGVDDVYKVVVHDWNIGERKHKIAEQRKLIDYILRKSKKQNNGSMGTSSVAANTYTELMSAFPPSLSLSLSFSLSLVALLKPHVHVHFSHLPFSLWGLWNFAFLLLDLFDLFLFFLSLFPFALLNSTERNLCVCEDLGFVTFTYSKNRNQISYNHI